MLACTLWHERARTQISVTLGIHKHHTHLRPWKKAIPLDDACQLVFVLIASAYIIISIQFLHFRYQILSSMSNFLGLSNSLPYQSAMSSLSCVKDGARETCRIALIGYSVIFHSCQVSNPTQRFAMIHRFFKWVLHIKALGNLNLLYSLLFRCYPQGSSEASVLESLQFPDYIDGGEGFLIHKYSNTPMLYSS